MIVKNCLPTIVILTGGLGTRLFPKTKNIPKSLVKINSKPFLFYQLKLLEKKKFKKIIISTGYKSNLIKNYLKKNNFNLDIIISNDGKKQLGTGGAIKKTLNELDEKFFVIFGDSYLDLNYINIYKKYLSLKRRNLIVCQKFKKFYEHYSIKPELIVKNNKIIEYKNLKNKMTHIYYGIGIFNKVSFKKINKNSFDLHFFFKKMILKKNLVSYQVSKKFFEIGSKFGLKETKIFFKKKYG